jgi:hypothetical protein
MRLKLLALAGLTFVSIAPAALAETPPAPPAEPPAAANRDDEIICRVEEETGSRLRRQKICMTRKEWRTGEADSGRAVGDAQRRSQTSQPLKGN